MVRPLDPASIPNLSLVKDRMKPGTERIGAEMVISVAEPVISAGAGACLNGPAPAKI